ncbi:MAG TPA: tetratricopeptide repeat protein, partial [Candidatus Polarisedimenticolia bacterium]
DPYAYYYLGSILADQGKHQEAAELFRKSLELDPLNPMAHYALARTLKRLGQQEASEAEFARHAEIMRKLRENKEAGVAIAE